MRIAIDARITDIYKGGSAIYTIKLIESLKKIDSTNKYFYFSKKKSYLIQEFNNFTWRKAWDSLNNHILGDAWEQIGFPLYLAKNFIDIYHATVERLPLLKLKTKYIVTIHDLSSMKFSQLAGSRQYIMYTKAQICSAVGKADKIIAPSQATKKDIMEKLNIPPGKIEVILQGIDKEMFKVLEQRKCANFLKDKYGIDRNYILAIGAFIPRKNFQRLFEACQKLISKDIDELLIIIGFQSWKDKEILKYAGKNILFVQNVPDSELPFFYNCADLFVYPSLNEGFGLALLEAMACGTPVAASNTSSIPEVVGDAALLFDPLNVEEMADTMKKILTDSELKQKLRKKGLERVKLFSWEKMAKETLALYKEIYGRYA
ncbi:MAG: glycosyltransferase family 4 protein [Candidatus Stahlbacteria bacterium]|nr:glycosyltransferase family 4 protein [Candidatus Stahlbacteria bacterium]